MEIVIFLLMAMKRKLLNCEDKWVTMEVMMGQLVKQLLTKRLTEH